MPSAERKQKWMLFATVWIAFAIVGGAISLLLLRSMSERVLADSKLDLLTIARLISLHVDGDEHEKLVDPAQMESDLYRRQVERLAEAQRNSVGIRYVYTMRKSGDAYHFVLDPTPPGDSDGDGVDDKSYLMEEYTEVDAEAKRALAQGLSIAAERIGTDRWGTFLTAYAPIHNSKGQVVAILGVDKEADDIEVAIRRFQFMAVGAFAMTLVIGLLVALLVSHVAFRTRQGARSEPVPTVKYGSTILQLVLIGLAGGTIVAGTMGYVFTVADEDRLRALNRRDEQLRVFKALLNQLAYEDEVQPAHIDALLHDDSIRHLGTFVPSLQRLRRLAEQKDSTVREQLRVILDAANGAEYTYLKQREQVLDSFADRRGDYILTLMVAVLLSCGSLVFVRVAFAQQMRLVTAHEEAFRLQRSYQLVVESLPVGLFQYRDGEITLSNWSFDSQTGRGPDETAMAALRRSLAPDDRERVLDALCQHEASEEPFTLHFRLADSGGHVEHFESRGIPTFDASGHLAHLLCFNVNISEIVSANQGLQERSEQVEAANERLGQAFRDLETNFVATVAALVKAVEAKDPYTAGHSDRVMRYSVAIGEAAGLEPDQLQTLRWGTLIHDVGKIGIPDGILTKPERLTTEEYAVIQRHAALGAEMVGHIPLFSPCVPIVRWHHERLDGSGYPDGIGGDELSDLVRIAAVADCFDAMTSTRAYRRGMPVDIALGELRKDASLGRLDGKFVEILADIIARDGLFEHYGESAAA